MIISKELYRRIKEKKKRLDRIRPLDSLQLKKIKERVEIEYIYNSTSIEGNTLTLDETRMILREGVTIGGKSLREHLDILNQRKAIEWIEELVKKKKSIREEDILMLHRITLKGISDYWAGRYKASQNRILGSKNKPTPPYKVRSEMDQLVYIINKNPERYNSVELAAIAHHKLVRTHPFVDGNGRTARLLTNLILMKKGFPPIMIKNTDRKKYFSTLEKAHFGNIGVFVEFIAQMLDSALLDYLSALVPTTRKTELISLVELAKTSPYTQEYLSLLARQGKISAVKINNIWHSTKEELKRYVDSKKTL